MNRSFDPVEADRLWVMDVTEHPTGEGKVYLAVVLDAFSRRVVGWSIADHIRSELVVDAVQMAIWRRQPPEGQTVAHSDHGSQYTSWAFGRRLRGAGLLGSMGTIGDCFDNSVAESFFGTLQLELLDEHRWSTRQQLALAIFDWIEAWYNPQTPALLLQDAQPHRLRGHALPPTSKRPREANRHANPPSQKPAEARRRRGWYEHTRRTEPLRLADRPHNQPVRWTGGSSVRRSGGRLRRGCRR